MAQAHRPRWLLIKVLALAPLQSLKPLFSTPAKRGESGWADSDATARQGSRRPLGGGVEWAASDAWAGAGGGRSRPSSAAVPRRVLGGLRGASEHQPQNPGGTRLRADWRTGGRGWRGIQITR